jgi:Leucine-rich repeat (LRR) protein
MLWCGKNQLTTLPKTLPAGLRDLYCYNNQLKTLPETLPAGLRHIYCQNNQLTTLPETLPSGLTTLSCYSNNLPDRPTDESIPDYVARVKAIAEKASKERIIARCALYFEELAKKVWHPSRVERLMLVGVDMEDM